MRNLADALKEDGQLDPDSHTGDEVVADRSIRKHVLYFAGFVAIRIE